MRLIGGRKTPVGHLIGLVEHHDAHIGECQRLLLDQVLQTSRAGNDDVGACVESTELAFILDTAIHRSDSHAIGICERSEHVTDLVGELTGRRSTRPRGCGMYFETPRLKRSDFRNVCESMSRGKS